MHLAARGCEAGVPCTTAGKSVVWNGGHRVLVAQDQEVKIHDFRLQTTTESQAVDGGQAAATARSLGYVLCRCRAFARTTDIGKAILFGTHTERVGSRCGASQQAANSGDGGHAERKSLSLLGARTGATLKSLEPSVET